MGNVVMEATQINYRRDEKLKTVDQKLQELSQESAIDTDIAPVFKSTETYHAGDLVYYRNKLYVFNVDHSGAWAVGDVTATNVSAAMNAALAGKADTSSLAGKADFDDIAGAFSAETAYTAGDLVNYNGTIYRCTNDHTGDWDADDFSATTIGAEIDAINSNFAHFCKSKTLDAVAGSTGISVDFTDNNSIFIIVGKSFVSNADTPFCFVVNTNNGLLPTIMRIFVKDLYGNYENPTVNLTAGNFTIELGTYATAFILSSHDFNASITTS